MKKMVLTFSAFLMVLNLSAQSFKTSLPQDTPNPAFLETTNNESELAVTVTLSSDLFVNEDGELTIDITLSEDSNDFEGSDLTFASASLISFSGSGSVYQAVIKPWSLDFNWDSIGGDAAIAVHAGVLTGTTSGSSNNGASMLFRTALFNDTYWSRGTPEVTLGQNRASKDPTKIYYVWSYPESGLREHKLGLNASDATVTNGYISKVSATGNGYEITVVPTNAGEVRVTIEGGQLDNANYSNVLGGTFYWNSTSPGVEITTDAPALTNQPFTATFNFSESVSGFSISDITVSNASLSNLSGSGDTYTVDVTPTATGEVTLQLGEATVTDNNGNGNFASEEVSVSYDADAPAVNISAATAVNTTFTANITFDEEVTGFELADISITNATAANFTGSGANYSVDITPVGSGDITIDIAAAAAQDAAGNESTVASQVTVIADVTAPGVVISADALVNGAFSTTITFSEEVTGFELSDIAVGNGTASNLLGSGANYTADVTPVTDGDVTLNIAADIAQDIAGNNNTAANEVTVSADLTAPGVSISAAALVNGVFTATITFDESVSGFELADITLANGSASNLSGSDDIYTVDITPTTDGDVTIDIAASAAQDAAGNGNTVASQVTVEADLTAPGVTISAVAIVNAAFTATITFDESVSGFESADIVLTNGTASNFSGADDTYTVDITPAADGNVTIDIPSAAAQDDAGNNNPAADQVTVLADFTAPEVVISANNLVNGAFTATITFSEEVAGFELSDISVGNGAASNLLGSGASYTADITPDSDADVTIDIAANIAKDAADNDNTAADQVTVMIDLIAPGVSVSADALVNGVFTATITFDEPVSGLELGDINLSNAAASNLSGSDAVYTVDITPLTDGEVTIDIAAAVAQDAAGNENTIADQVTIQADLTAPTATITADTYVFNDFSVTVTFDESVTGFDASDVTVTNGTLSNFTGSGDTYTFDIALVNEGEITIDIAVNAASDAATNENPAAQKVIHYDATQPTVIITADDYVNGLFTASITFSESVSGFELADLVVTNATTANLSGSGTDYTVDVTPTAEGAITFDIAGDVAADAAGNDNTAATQKVSEADFTAPTARIVAVQDLAWNNNEQNASVTFSEDVLDFTADDVIITNGNLVSMTYKSHLGLYFLTIQPTAEGVLTIDVAADVATDEAGNGNLVVEQKAIPTDFTAPVVTISSPEGTVSKLDVIPISFNAAEDIYVDYPEDIVVTNGVLTHDDEYENFFLEPAGEGTVTMTVPVHAISDDALNELTAPLSFSIESDQTAPTFIFDALGDIYWEEGSNSLEIEFSEAVAGLTTDDFTVSNGTLDALTAGTGNTWTLTITPTGEGSVDVTLAAGAVTDQVDLANEEGSFSIIADYARPSVTVSGPDTKVNGTFQVAIEFSEAVTGFEAADINCTRCVAGNVEGSDASYTVDITPNDGEGSVKVEVRASIVEDIVGRNNTSSNVPRYVTDYVAPFARSISVPDYANGTFTITITLTEEVEGFDLSDIITTNASVANLSGSGTVYTVDITPVTDGIVTIDLPTGMWQDEAGNDNLAATQRTVMADFTAPTLVVEAPEYVNGTAIVTLTFSEDVTGLVQSDMVVANGVVTGFTGSGSVYTARYFSDDEAEMKISFPAGIGQDAAGNLTLAGPERTIIVDYTAPLFTISHPEVVSGPFTATITFTEPVTGFELSDLTTTNANLSNLQGSDALYTVDVVPTKENFMFLNLSSNKAQDLAGNGNSETVEQYIPVDFTAPTVAISAPAIANGTFGATFTFSEEVTGFESSDVTLVNATIANFTGDGTIFTADITPVSEGNITLDIAAAVATDLGGNSNETADQQSILVDLTAPGVTITVDDPIVDRATVTITFDEAVTGFELADLVISNGIASNLLGSDANYTFDLRATATGDLTIDIAEGVAQDGAGNGNLAAEQKVVSAQVIIPEVVIAAPSLTNAAFEATITFSELVGEFDISDIVVGNGNASALAGDGIVYTVQITPVTDGDVTIDIPADAVVDIDDNGNTAAEQRVTLADLTAPTVNITGSDVTDHTITYTFTFSEEVTGFELADLTVENGALSNFSGSGDTYTVDVAGEGSGSMKLTLAAAAVQDLAGNTNEEVSVENDLGYEFAPVFISTPTTSIDNSSTSYYSYAIEVTDDNGDDIDISAPVLPDWLSLDNIYTVSTAYTSRRLRGIAVDSKGNIFTTNITDDVIYKFDTEGNQTVFAGTEEGYTDGTGTEARFKTLNRMAIDSEDNLYVVDQSNRTIRKITPSGVVSTLAGTNTSGAEDGTGTDARFNSIGDITVDNNTGNVYVITQYGSAAALRQISSEGVVTTLTSSADGNGITADSEGNLFYMNDSYQVIKRDVSGNEAVLAGGGVERGSLALQYIDGTGTAALFDDIYGMEVDDDGNLYLSDYGLLRRVSPEGIVTTLAGSPNSHGFRDGVSTNARFLWQFDIAVVSAEEIYVGDDFNERIRKVTGQPALLGRPNVSAGNYDVRLEAADDVTEPTSQAFTIAVSDVAAEIQSIEILPIEEPDFIYVDFGNILFEGFPVQYAVTYNKEVFVTGEPYIELSLAGERLTYKSGSGSDRLIFEWTATADLNDSKEISYAGTDALKLNGGSIKDLDGTDMPLVLTDSFDSFFRVDKWTVKSITTTATDGTYGIGDELEFIVEFESGSEFLSIDPTYDFVTLILNIENDDDDYFDQYENDYEAGLEPNQVRIRVVVEEGDYTSDLDFVQYKEGDHYDFGDGAAYLYGYSYSDDYDFEFDGVFEFTDPDINHSIAAVKDIVIDGVRPTVDISFDNTIGTSFVATLTFSEEISGLELADLVVGNGVASNLSGSGKVYTVDIAPTALGAVTLDMDAELVIDVAGNGNAVAEQASALAVSDSDNFNTTLTAVYDLDNAGYINAENGGTATIVFDKDVTGFEQSDIATTNLNITSFVAISGSEYQVYFEAVAEGPASMDVPAHVATDGTAGNSAATQLSMMADVTAPGVTIVADALVNGVFTATITFDESVTGFELSEINVGNGNASNLAGSGANYTVDITPATDGDVTLDIAAAVAQDAAENDNTVADQLTVSADLTAPGVAILADALVNGAFTATITFDESVTGFELSDINVGNGNASNLAGTDANYTVDITPTTDGDVTLDIAAAVVQDAAENDNTVADQLTVSADLTAPGVAISADALINGVFTATITFDESVTGFELADIIVGNGTAANLSGTGAVYTVEITPVAGGEVTLDVPADVAQDAAENGNTAATQLSVETDTTAPDAPEITGISDDTGRSDSDGITSDKRIIIRGTAEPEAEVEIFSQFGLFSSTKADANGDWILDNTHQDLFEIVVNLTAEAIDVAGNRSATSDVFVLTPDFTAPAKPVITGISDDTGSSDSDGITSDKRIIIQGTAEPNSEVEIFSQFGFFSSAQADANGDWILDNTHQNLFEIVVNLTAEAIDVAGNRSATSDVFVLTPDFTAPAKPIITGISDDTGASDTDGITNDKRITIHGTAEPGARVEIFSQFGLFNSTQADANGDWVLDNTHQNLFEIVVNLTAEAIDVAGNRSATSDVFVLTPDFTAPAKPLITGISDDTGISDSDGITNDKRITIHGTAEPGTRVEIFSQFGYFNSAQTDANGDWVLDNTHRDLFEIGVNLTAEAVDLAGNRSATSDVFVLTPDFTAPVKPLITGITEDTGSSDSDGITSDKRIKIMGTAEPGSRVEIFSQFGYFNSAQADANGDWVLDNTHQNLFEIAVNLTAEAVDLAGNRSMTSDVFVLTPDFTEPDVAISVESSAAEVYTISAVFSEEVSGLQLDEVTVTGGRASELTQQNATTYTFLVTSSGGVTDVAINAGAAQDVAGNSSTASNQLTLNASPVAGGEALINSVDFVEPEKIPSVNVYPNPASKWLTIDLSEVNAESVDVAIVSLSGKSVFGTEDFGKQELKVDVSGYDNGLYLVLISTGTDVLKKKVLVKK